MRCSKFSKVLHLRAASFDVSGCDAMSYEFISIVRNEEVAGSIPVSSTKLFNNIGSFSES
jgi:hypothetical protein